MADIQISRAKINHVVAYILNTCEQSAGDLHPVELLLAMSESIGRIIAVQSGTELVHNDMLKMARNHMSNTVRAGYSAAGKNPEAIQ